jgi:hypothetical protein
VLERFSLLGLVAHGNTMHYLLNVINTFVTGIKEESEMLLCKTCGRYIQFDFVPVPAICIRSQVISFSGFSFYNIGSVVGKVAFTNSLI